VAGQSADVRLRFTIDATQLRKELRTVVGKDMQRATKGLNRSLQKVNRTVESGTKSVSKNAAQTSKLKQAMEGLSSAANIFMGLGLYRLFGAGTRAVREATRAQIEFNQSIAEANSLVSGSASTFEFFEDQVLDVAKQVPQKPSELGAGVYQILSGGILNAADSTEVLKSASRAASAGLTSTEQAAETLVRVLNAYNLEVDQASRVSDLLFQTVKRGIVRFEELGTSLGTVLPVAAAFNVRMEELFGAIQTMTKGGLSARKSTTALRQAIQLIVQPSNKAQEAAKELGVEMGGAALEGKGLIGFFEDFTEKVGLVQPAAQQMIQQMISGQKSFEDTKEDLRQMGGAAEKVAEIFTARRGLMAATLLAGKQFDKFQKNVSATQDSQGAMREAFERTTDSIKAQAQIAQNNLAVAFRDLIPLMKSGAERAVELTRFLSENKRIIADVAVTVTTLVGALAAMKTAMIGASVIKEVATVTSNLGASVAGLTTNYQLSAAATAASAETQKAHAVVTETNTFAIQKMNTALATSAAKMSAFAAVGLGLAGTFLEMRDANEALTFAVQTATASLAAMSTTLYMLKASISPTIAAITGLGAAVFAFAGQKKIGEALQEDVDRVEDFKETLRGTQSDIKRDFFDEIQKNANKTADQFKEAMQRMQEAADQVQMEAGFVPENVQMPSVTAEEARSRAESLRNVNQPGHERVDGGGLSGFFNTIKEDISQAAEGTRQYTAETLNALGITEDLSTVRQQEADQLEQTAKVLEDVTKANNVIDAAMTEAASTFQEQSDLMRETARSNARAMTAERAEEVRAMEAGQEKRQAIADLEDKRASIVEEQMRQAEAATLASELQAQSLGISAQQAKSFASTIVEANGDLKALETASGELAFQVTSTEDRFGEVEEQAETLTERMTEFETAVAQFSSGEMDVESFIGDGVSDFVKEVVRITDDFNNLSSETEKIVGQFERLQKLISALEFIQLVRDLEAGPAIGAAMSDQSVETQIGEAQDFTEDTSRAILEPINRVTQEIESFSLDQAREMVRSMDDKTAQRFASLANQLGETQIQKITEVFSASSMPDELTSRQFQSLFEKAANDAVVAQDQALSKIRRISHFFEDAEFSELRSGFEQLDSAAAQRLRKFLEGVEDEQLSIAADQLKTAMAGRGNTTELGEIMMQLFPERREGGMIPSFEGGGVVPGGDSRPVPALLHGGEMVLTAEQTRKLIKQSENVPSFQEGTSDVSFVDFNQKDAIEAMKEAFSQAEFDADTVDLNFVNRMIDLIFRDAADSAKELSERAGDVAGAMSNMEEPLRFAVDNWTMVNDGLTSVGVSLSNAKTALDAISEVQIMQSMLDMLTSLRTIQDEVGGNRIRNLSSAIEGTQMAILDEGQRFLQSLMTDDPEKLARTLAREMSVKQEIDQSSDTTIVLRISTDADTRGAVEIADRVQRELRRRERQSSGGFARR